MSIATSFHIWSSLKNPLSSNTQVKKKKPKLNVSHVDSFDGGNKVNNPGGIVNLRVPRAFREGNDTSIPVIVSVSSNSPKKITSRKSIAHVVVPDILDLYGREDDGCQKPIKDELNLIFDEKSQDFNRSDDGKEFDCIPFVKPWTAEELQEVTNRYVLLEEERVKRRRKQRTNLKREMGVAEPSANVSEATKPLEQTSSHDLIPVRKRFKAIAPQQESFSPVQSENHNDIPLAELYMINLGISR